jgi:hypothetical protein
VGTHNPDLSLCTQTTWRRCFQSHANVGGSIPPAQQQRKKHAVEVEYMICTNNETTQNWYRKQACILRTVHATSGQTAAEDAFDRRRRSEYVHAFPPVRDTSNPIQSIQAGLEPLLIASSSMSGRAVGADIRSLITASTYTKNIHQHVQRGYQALTGEHPVAGDTLGTQTMFLPPGNKRRPAVD